MFVWGSAALSQDGGSQGLTLLQEALFKGSTRELVPLTALLERRAHLARPGLGRSPRERGLVSAARRSCGLRGPVVPEPREAESQTCALGAPRASLLNRSGDSGAARAPSCGPKGRRRAQAQLRTPMPLPAGEGPARRATRGPGAACWGFRLIAPQRKNNTPACRP